MGTGRHLLVSAVWPGWAHPRPGPTALPENSAISVLVSWPRRQRRRMAAGQWNLPTRRLLRPTTASAALRCALAAGTGRATAVQVPEAIGPAGAPTPTLGILASSSHSVGSTCPAWNGSDGRSFGGETLHFQAGLEDPGGRMAG